MCESGELFSQIMQPSTVNEILPLWLKRMTSIHSHDRDLIINFVMSTNKYFGMFGIIIWNFLLVISKNRTLLYNKHSFRLSRTCQEKTETCNLIGTCFQTLSLSHSIVNPRCIPGMGVTVTAIWFLTRFHDYATCTMYMYMYMYSIDDNWTMRTMLYRFFVQVHSCYDRSQWSSFNSCRHDEQ